MMAAFYGPQYYGATRVTSESFTTIWTSTGTTSTCPNCGYELSEEPCYYTSSGISAETPPKPKESRPWVRKSTGRPPRRLEMK